ncbi:MAG: hypothetical protein JNK92_10405 [Dechloromonas sp.]|nr:hypothetical protein [Dechloromonas sp.]
MTKFHDLTFNRQPDGSIRLTQSDCGEDSIIDLHPAQLRYMAESFGLVGPRSTGDELSKRLARQLCEIQRGLVSECHRSWWLERLFVKLDAYCSSLPDDIFPHDLWRDDAPDAQEAPLTPEHAARKPNPPLQPAVEAEARSDGQQLGLEV